MLDFESIRDIICEPPICVFLIHEENKRMANQAVGSEEMDINIEIMDRQTGGWVCSRGCRLDPGRVRDRTLRFLRWELRTSLGLFSIDPIRPSRDLVLGWVAENSASRKELSSRILRDVELEHQTR